MTITWSRELSAHGGREVRYRSRPGSSDCHNSHWRANCRPQVGDHQNAMVFLIVKPHLSLQSCHEVLSCLEKVRTVANACTACSRSVPKARKDSIQDPCCDFVQKFVRLEERLVKPFGRTCMCQQLWLLRPLVWAGGSALDSFFHLYLDGRAQLDVVPLLDIDLSGRARKGDETHVVMREMVDVGR